MCGISGVVSLLPNDHEILLSQARANLFHRGPDYFGYKKINNVLTLAHNRLSILDLNPRSNQPFDFGIGSLVFNGEIYNYLKLRDSIAALPQFRTNHFSTQSDTEVLAAGLSIFGEEFVDSIDGMYAFSWFNSQSQELILAADPFGIKQIYYYHSPSLFIFGSEFEFVCNTLIELGRTLAVDQFSFDCTYSFLSPCIGSTLFQNVHRLLPGQLIKIFMPSVLNNHQIGMESMSARSHLFGSSCTIASQSLRVATNSISNHLNQAMYSDARVAALCSGGIDSTVIAQAYAIRSGESDKLSLLTAKHPPSKEGFVDDFFYANQVAKKLNLPIHSSTIKALDWERFCLISDSISCPGDITAASPLYDLCSFANDRGFKVLFSGLGADEIFGGYRQHQLLALQSILNQKARHLFALLFSVLPNIPLMPSPFRRRFRLSSRQIVSGPLESTIQSMCWGSSSAELLKNFQSLLTMRASILAINLSSSTVKNAQLLFFLHFLASTHLPVTDSVSMRFSVELRPVFLSKTMFNLFHRPLSAFAALIPKFILKYYLLSRFSLSFVFRPKSGFGSEPCNSNSLFYENLYRVISESSFLPDSLKERVNSDCKLQQFRGDSRSRYGLIALAHASRLVSRILNKSSIAS